MTTNSLLELEALLYSRSTPLALLFVAFGGVGLSLCGRRAMLTVGGGLRVEMRSHPAFAHIERERQGFDERHGALGGEIGRSGDKVIGGGGGEEGFEERGRPR